MSIESPSPLPRVHRLGAYVDGLRVEDFPPSVLERVASCLLYNLSLGMVAAEPEHAVQKAIRSVHPAHGVANLLGGGEARSAADAAAINAAAITLRGQNDTHAAMNGHVGCLVVPAVLALAQERGSDLQDVLAALVAGYEVAPRIGDGMAATAMARGWRGTSLFGVFGVAAACARLLRCAPDQVAHALSLAANFAGGLVRCYAEGTPEWAAQVAHASRAGMQAALLAHQGMQAAAEILEGSGGFYQALGGEARPLSLQDWWIEDVSFKPFPGCAINQVPTAVLLDLVRSESLDAGQVAGVTLSLHPSHAAYPGVDRHGPFNSEAAAIMSAPFMLQLALEHGSLRQADFADRFGAGALHTRSQQVRVVADASLAPFACQVQVALRDGGTREAASAGTRGLMMDWERTVVLTRSLAAEQPRSFGEAAHVRLVRAVQRCVHTRDTQALDDLFKALLPATS